MDARGKEYLDDMFLRLAQVMGCTSSMDAATKYHEMLERLHLSRPEVKSIEELELLAGSVNPERLGNNPVRLENAVLRSLYARIAK